MQLFISYSRKDRDAVNVLANDIRNYLKTLPPNTVSGVWLDQDIPGTHDWWDDILEHIRFADLIVVAVSKSYYKSDACALEREYAVKLNKRIMPIKIAQDASNNQLPEELRRIQLVDYSTQDKSAYQQLIQALSSLPSPQPLPSPLPEPPKAPESQLSLISNQLQATTISSADQADIFFKLQGLLKEEDTASEAYELLQRLKTHSDARAQVVENINNFINNVRQSERTTPKPNEYVRPTIKPAATTTAPKTTSKAPWIGAIIGAVIGIIGSISAAYQTEYSPYIGYYGTYNYSTICVGFVIFALIGYGIGWTYAKFKR